MRKKQISIKRVLPVTISVLALIQCQIALAAKEEQTVTVDRKAPAEIEKINAPFKMPQLKRPEFQDKTFNIRNYGAKDDGKTKNTTAFKNAIEACTTAGGGKVLVPAGKWLTGAIHLKSNVNLHFEQGAELHFSDKPEDYLPAVFTRHAGYEVTNYSPLIYAYNCENIAITGPGKLFGHGEKWWLWVKSRVNKKTGKRIYEDASAPVEKPRFSSRRPQFINPVQCKNVLLEGFTVAEPGPFWTIHLVYCENVIARDLRIEAIGGPNNDGLNLDSCKNALVEYCYFDTGDDCIALKSGMNEDGRRVRRPTENVVIRHITTRHGHGGIVVGSDSSGGVRNVFAYDCHFIGTLKGIRMKSNALRGGVMENFLFEDIIMKNIISEAIVINTRYYMASKKGKFHPIFRNITYRRITCDGARVAASFEGSSREPVRDITMEDVSIRAKSGMRFEWVTGLKLKNVDIKASRGKPLDFQNCQDVAEQD